MVTVVHAVTIHNYISTQSWGWHQLAISSVNTGQCCDHTDMAWPYIMWTQFNIPKHDMILHKQTRTWHNLTRAWREHTESWRDFPSLTRLHKRVLTSPKAPLPMTLSGSKSCTPSFDLLSRRNSVSLQACCCLFSFFCRTRTHEMTLSLHCTAPPTFLGDLN